MKGPGVAILPIGVVALLAALTFWLDYATNPEDPGHKAQKRHDPDFVIGQVHVRRFDASGALKQALIADTITHYPDDNTTDIAKPQMTYYNGEKATQIFSNTAKASDDNKKIVLLGDVRLVKPAYLETPETTLRTQTMTVFPDDDIAQGTSRVTITRGPSVVSGDVMYYNGKSEVSVLSGRVKGIFYRARNS